MVFVASNTARAAGVPTATISVGFLPLSETRIRCRCIRSSSGLMRRSRLECLTERLAMDSQVHDDERLDALITQAAEDIRPGQRTREIAMLRATIETMKLTANVRSDDILRSRLRSMTLLQTIHKWWGARNA